ncbi:hypothetical protein TrLO_g5478 [Triparma laevis f. longispina]|uniref:Uncharacterized protein n=2 Tax=Triparma laevis f. longispina TaxID=1714387 RepID=A0A9W7DLS3_9STRA|nr:hypothetical protein TrLO_g5478 [Triparma laevis f. longispina]
MFTPQPQPPSSPPTSLVDPKTSRPSSIDSMHFDHGVSGGGSDYSQSPPRCIGRRDSNYRSEPSDDDDDSLEEGDNEIMEMGLTNTPLSADSYGSPNSNNPNGSYFPPSPSPFPNAGFGGNTTPRNLPNISSPLFGREVRNFSADFSPSYGSYGKNSNMPPSKPTVPRTTPVRSINPHARVLEGYQPSSPVPIVQSTQNTLNNCHTPNPYNHNHIFGSANSSGVSTPISSPPTLRSGLIGSPPVLSPPTPSPLTEGSLSPSTSSPPLPPCLDSRKRKNNSYTSSTSPNSSNLPLQDLKRRTSQMTLTTPSNSPKRGTPTSLKTGFHMLYPPLNSAPLLLKPKTIRPTIDCTRRTHLSPGLSSHLVHTEVEDSPLCLVTPGKREGFSPLTREFQGMDVED